MVKAIGLYSGGLDSMLSLKIIKDLGIEVIALHAKSIFAEFKKEKVATPKQIAERLGIELITINITQELTDIIKNPQHGFGSNLNPCIDCKILIFKKAKELMKEMGTDFIFTGEVLGQRPMSQKKNTMRMIEKKSGLEGLVLRPLSAKLLPPTIPEMEGKIDREKLFDLKGRGRKKQMELAKKYDLLDYPTPASGCKLTEPNFARRVKDLLDNKSLNINDIELLKVGRHFRVSPNTKIIVGRKESDNQKIAQLTQEDDILLEALNIPSPLTLIRGKNAEKFIDLAAKFTARYCKSQTNNEITIKVWKVNSDKQSIIKTQKADDKIIKENML